MAALILPALFLAWTLLCTWVADQSGNQLAQGAMRTGFKALLLLALLPLPLLDELLARPQFETLCRERAVVTVHQRPQQARNVHAPAPSTEAYPGLAVPVQVRRSHFIDTRTGELLASFTTLQAAGGKLARTAAADAPPLTFTGHCAPPDPAGQLALLGLKIAPPPQAAEGAP